MQDHHGSVFLNHICESLVFLLPLEFLRDDNSVKGSNFLLLLKETVSEETK